MNREIRYYVFVVGEGDWIPEHLASLDAAREHCRKLHKASTGRNVFRIVCSDFVRTFRVRKAPLFTWEEQDPGVRLYWRKRDTEKIAEKWRNCGGEKFVLWNDCQKRIQSYAGVCWLDMTEKARDQLVKGGFRE